MLSTPRATTHRKSGGSLHAIHGGRADQEGNFEHVIASVSASASGGLVVHDSGLVASGGGLIVADNSGVGLAASSSLCESPRPVDDLNTGTDAHEW